jgi:hypothetical protein
MSCSTEKSTVKAPHSWGKERAGALAVLEIIELCPELFELALPEAPPTPQPPNPPTIHLG